jgi:hypothetical protein
VLAYQKFLLPLVTTGLVKVLVHVRAGDSLWSADAPKPKDILESMGIRMYEASTMDEASAFIKDFLNHH